MKINTIITIFLLLLFSLSDFVLSQEMDVCASSAYAKLNTNSVQGSESLWDVQFNFDVSQITGGRGLAAVVLIEDKNEFWVARWNSDILFRLAKNGNLLEQFSIPGISNIRGMTYDGWSVYAANNTTEIFEIDPDTKTVVASVDIGYTARWITYDLTTDNFWVGNFDTDPTLFTRTGSVVKSIPHANLGTTAIYGGACDVLSDGGPYLWVWGQNGGYGDPQTIAQVNIDSKSFTGVSHNVNSDIGADQADSALAGGLYWTSEYSSGKITLIGLLQGRTNRLFGYELSEPVVYPDNINLNRTYSFSSITSSEDYKLIGLPGDNFTPIQSLISGSQGTDWNVFFDTGESSDYLLEYNGSMLFSFMPGIGFWVISKNQISASGTVSSVTLEQGNGYAIALHSGWNIIANPFNAGIRWSDVISANSLAQNTSLFDWTRQWTQSSIFEPYKGYYFYNSQNRDALFIPYAPTPLGKITPTEPALSVENFITVNLLENGIEKSSVVIGLQQGSAVDFDEFDYLLPPGDFEETSLSLINNDLSIGCKRLQRDVRPETDEPLFFDLRVINKKNIQLKLKFNGCEEVTNKNILLWDKDLNYLKDLKESGSVTFPAGRKNKDYTIVICGDEYAENLAGDLLPAKFELHQNFPNPFNPVTNIRYQIPETAKVTLKIYDPLGKEIESLVNKTQEAGIYEYPFDATKYASGVYYYRINVEGIDNNFTQTRKMAAVK